MPRSRTEPHLAIRAIDDTENDGHPDICHCTGNLNLDALVNVTNLLVLLAAWGPCP